jgi:hypothetical protein
MNNMNGMIADFSLYIVTTWNNEDKYKGQFGPFYIFDEANKKYEESLNNYENATLTEIQNHAILIKSKFAE